MQKKLLFVKKTPFILLKITICYLFHVLNFENTIQTTFFEDELKIVAFGSRSLFPSFVFLPVHRFDE
jgi:hypothetical protein